MIRLAILGSTGSIGVSALDVVAAHPGRFDVVGLAAGGNIGAMQAQVAAVRPRAVAMATDQALRAVEDALPADVRQGVATWASGREGLSAVATHPDVDVVLCACSGTEALEAVLAAIDAGKRIALANKEVLVMAGALVMARARARGVDILPVDSEHNAIHQCLAGHSQSHVRRLVLTASGGPFRTLPVEALSTVTAADALSHPTWKMGRKITVDSATMMNKGLEVIEARWLFNLPAERIQVIIHPQSIVHSLVQYADGSVIAELGNPDMRTPIAHALAYPRRIAAGVAPLDLCAIAGLHFERPDFARCPCLALAYRALRAGGTASATLNAANEVAVDAFLAGRIGFTAIPRLIEEVMDHLPAGREPASLAEVLAADRAARRAAEQCLVAGVCA